jgi:hypothetical protein
MTNDIEHPMETSTPQMDAVPLQETTIHPTTQVIIEQTSQPVTFEQPIMSQPVYEQPIATTTTYMTQEPAVVNTTTIIQVGETPKEDEMIVAPAQPLDPIIVAVISWFVPGVGHYLIGQQQKGMAFLAFWIAEWVILVALSFLFIGICLAPFALAYHLLVAYDGYQIARRLQDKQPVAQGECAHAFVAKLPLSMFVKSRIFVKNPTEAVQAVQPPTEVVVATA